METAENSVAMMLASLGGVIAALILVAGEHNAQRTVADPGGDAVDCKTAGNLEEGRMTLVSSAPTNSEQAEVEQQRWQKQAAMTKMITSVESRS